MAAMANAEAAESLLQLVLRSRKALDHAKTLCLRAETLSSGSAQHAVDLLALDAKVTWISDGILEQLKLVSAVAKTLNTQRSKLQEEAKAWDSKRSERIATLDSLLDSLGSQLVPLALHETATDSSLFGSQHSHSDHSDSHTALAEQHNRTGIAATDRGKWRSLRYFVDERSIEDALDRIEEDRNALDDLLESTAAHPQALIARISAIKNSLPSSSPLDTAGLLHQQEKESMTMAKHLEDLAHHFGQMETALNEHEAGDVVGEEDIEIFIRDTAELPSIIAEMEESLRLIEDFSVKFKEGKAAYERQLDFHQSAVSSLEELGLSMGNMLEHQRNVEVEVGTLHRTLTDHLTGIFELQSTYTHYRTAYGKLVLEMDRRRQYRESANAIVRGMTAQLQALREEEISRREQFFKSEGAYLPEDLCPYVGEPPTMFEVLATNEEVAINLDPAYIAEVQVFLKRFERQSTAT